jgi:hypothetical protein
MQVIMTQRLGKGKLEQEEPLQRSFRNGSIPRIGQIGWIASNAGISSLASLGARRK